MTVPIGPDDLGRSPPHDSAAEDAVVGAMVLDNGMIPIVRDLLVAGDFYGESHQRLFAAVLALVDAGKGVDLVILCEELRRRGDLNIVGGSEALVRILDGVPTSANAEHYAGIVRDMAYRRRAIDLATRVDAAARNGGDLSGALGDLGNLTSYLGGEGVGSRLQEESGADAAAVVIPEGGPPSLSILGRPLFIVKGWTHLLAGYPRCGKTELLVRLIRGWLDAGLRVLYFTEEPRSIWITRLKRLEGDWSGLRLVYAMGSDPAQLRSRAETGTEEVVILDTLRNLLRLKDETNNSEIAEVVNPWVGVSRKKDKTLLMAHHSRKGGGEHGEGIAGGHALLGSFDIAIELLRVPNSPNRRHLRAYARLVDPGELVYERDEHGTFRPLGDPSDLKREELKARILDSLGEDWQSTEAVRAECPEESRPSLEALRLALGALAEEGKAERHPPMSAGKVPGKRVQWRRQPTSNPPLPRVGGEDPDDLGDLQ